MVNIGPNPLQSTESRILPWHDGPFKTAVGDYFLTSREPTSSPKSSIVRIKTDFTCRYIDKDCGIAIQPTDNLMEHLRLVDHNTKVYVFHHVAFLERVEKWDESVFPPGLIRETLDTLALLFPNRDSKTKTWIESAEQTGLDRRVLRCGDFTANDTKRLLEHYPFWRERLITLIEAADQAASPIQQILKPLKDRKSGDRWFESWIAIVAIGLTLFFGLVQSIEGAIQVYKAYHPEDGSTLH